MNRGIKLLGTAEIREEGSPLPLPPRAIALLAYLIITNQPLGRETAARLLWGREPTAQSLTNLQMLVAQIQQWLPELEVTADWVAFRPSSETTVDFLALQQALDGKTFIHQEQVVSLYRGNLLEAFYLPGEPRFNEWLLIARERLRFRVTAVFRALCQFYERTGEWDDGVTLARRWIHLDPIDEEPHYYLINFLAKNHQIKEALHHYHSYRQQLWSSAAARPFLVTQRLALEVAAQKGRPTHHACS